MPKYTLPNPWMLNPIGLKNLAQGGYDITYNNPPRPPGTHWWFCVGSDDNHMCFEPLGFKPNRLAELMQLIANKKCWGKSVLCWYVLGEKGQVVSNRSNAVKLQCPVEPHYGPLGPASLGAAKPAFPYWNAQFNAMNYHRIVRIGAWHHLVTQANKFEIDPMRRGFDAVNFLTCAFGLPAAVSSSAALSFVELQLQCFHPWPPDDGMSPVQLNFNLQSIANKFPPNLPLLIWGYHANWIEAMVVIKGMVHEFHPKAGGYRKVPLSSRTFDVGATYSVRGCKWLQPKLAPEVVGMARIAGAI